MTASTIGRSKSLRLAALSVLCAVATVNVAHAQGDSFPSKPVRFVVPFAAGGQTDVIARSLATEMARQLGQPVVVENKVGAAGALAAEFVANAPADGYTVCFCGSGPMILLPLIDATTRNFPRDLAPVSLVYLSEYVLIGSSTLKSSTAQELVADMRARPGQYSFGSSGVGGIQQLGMELLSSAVNGKMVHVPYKGEQPAAIDVATGQVDLLMSTIATAAPLVKAGRVKMYAVSGAERNPEFPALPTLASLGMPEVVVYTHAGLNVPRGTSQAVIDRLNAAVSVAMKSGSLVTRFKENALITPALGATAYADYVTKETAKWSKIARSINFKRE